MSKCHANYVERLEPRTLLSDVIPVGPEFRVNTYTTGSQWLTSVALDAVGDFVVAWTSYEQDGDDYGVFAQRFNSTGAPQGNEFRVNSYTTGGQVVEFRCVAMDAAGDFVIAWTSYEGQDGSDNGVYAQRYDSLGVQRGSEFRVNSFTTGQQGKPSIAMDADGDFVITWYGRGATDDFGVFAQRYNSTGVPQGDEFRVNSYTTGNQSKPTVAANAGGDFVVAWGGQGTEGAGIYAQRYDFTGVPQGGEFRVAAGGSPSAAMDADGDFVIAYQQSGIYARRYNSAGVAQGAEFLVNTHTTGSKQLSSAAMDASGDFVVVWISFGQDGSGHSIHGQRYNSAGIPQGDEFRVNSYTTGHQYEGNVAMDAAGDFVVVWDSDGQDGSLGVYSQRYAAVPEVTASSFHFATAPHTLSFTFDRDVSASLGTDDLIVQNLTTKETLPASLFAVSFDPDTNVATFTYSGATAGITGMLPDGNYTATLIASGITTIQGAPLANDYVLNFQFLQGDANNDGQVNLNDFNILAGNFGLPNRIFSQGDFNYDAQVNLNDFNILAGRFGGAVGPQAFSSMRIGGAAGQRRILDALRDEVLG